MDFNLGIKNPIFIISDIFVIMINVNSIECYELSKVCLYALELTYKLLYFLMGCPMTWCKNVVTLYFMIK